MEFRSRSGSINGVCWVGFFIHYPSSIIHYSSSIIIINKYMFLSILSHPKPNSVLHLPLPLLAAPWREDGERHVSTTWLRSHAAESNQLPVDTPALRRQGGCWRWRASRRHCFWQWTQVGKSSNEALIDMCWMVKVTKEDWYYGHDGWWMTDDG